MLIQRTAEVVQQVNAIRPDFAAVDAVPAWTPVLVSAPRFNPAGVCLYCERRGCVAPRCAQLHAVAVWAVCPDCDGTTWRNDDDLTRCCSLGITELDPRSVIDVATVTASVVPVSVPPALLSVPVPRCLTCGHRTVTGHPDCALPRGGWWPCRRCAGRRTDSDGFECQNCDGVGFIDESANDTLAERADDVRPW